MTYTGDDCGATSHSLDPSKVECDDFGALLDSVYIIASSKSNPDDGKSKPWFEGPTRPSICHGFPPESA